MSVVGLFDVIRVRLCCGLRLGFLCLSLGVCSVAQAKLLSVVGSDQAAPLQCPRGADAKKGRAPVAPSDAPQPPDREEVEALSPDAVAEAQDLSFQESPSVFHQQGFLRMALWGDSHAAARFFSDALVEGLGYMPEAVQPGFIPPTMGLAGVRLPLRKTCQGPGWTRSLAYRAGGRVLGFGKGLARAGTEMADSYLWLDFRATNSPQGLRALDVRLSAPDGRGSPRTVLAVSVNDSPEEVVAIDRESDRVLQIRSDFPVMTVKMRLIAGQLMLDGLVPHHASAPALIMDTFGIPGATAKGWENIDPGFLRDEEAAQPYDVVLLEYGTNEGNDTRFAEGKYAASLRATLRNLRAVYPQAVCILIGPTDRGVLLKRSAGRTKVVPRRPGADILAYSRKHRVIAEVQERVGREFDCLSWDWQAAMGGPGGAYRWLYQQPPLMSRDLIHLTALGYQKSGHLLAQKLRGNPAVTGRP